ncbi:hypothetical protein GQ53DRAFT_363004 [Thozetella sp. PMI_491]|nr:hypothetical protein GQ53DRAFT_363004 [Thozetella sp. PMI_491]
MGGSRHHVGSQVPRLINHTTLRDASASGRRRAHCRRRRGVGMCRVLSTGKAKRGTQEATGSQAGRNMANREAGAGRAERGDPRLWRGEEREELTCACIIRLLCYFFSARLGECDACGAGLECRSVTKQPSKWECRPLSCGLWTSGRAISGETHEATPSSRPDQSWDHNAFFGGCAGREHLVRPQGREAGSLSFFLVPVCPDGPRLSRPYLYGSMSRKARSSRRANGRARACPKQPEGRAGSALRRSDWG